MFYNVIYSCDSKLRFHHFSSLQCHVFLDENILLFWFADSETFIIIISDVYNFFQDFVMIRKFQRAAFIWNRFHTFEVCVIVSISDGVLYLFYCCCFSFCSNVLIFCIWMWCCACCFVIFGDRRPEFPSCARANRKLGRKWKRVSHFSSPDITNTGFPVPTTAQTGTVTCACIICKQSTHSLTLPAALQTTNQNLCSRWLTEV